MNDTEFRLIMASLEALKTLVNIQGQSIRILMETQKRMVSQIFKLEEKTRNIS